MKLKGTHIRSLILTFILFFLYFIFSYHLEREEFYKLLIIYFGLFLISYFLIIKEKNNFYFLAGLAILSRLIFIFSIPNLSQDFYRFIWDGRLIANGLNPYLSLPEVFISQNNFPVNQAKELYLGMGELNGSHYTNYPPLNQFCFYIASLMSNNGILGSVIVMRIIIILSDIGILYFGKKLLEDLNLPVYTIFWYILNPFIIIELTGNLHFEAVMLFFLVWSLYLIHKKKWIWAAILFAFSISIKLIPLIFLPILYQWFVKDNNRIGTRNIIGFYTIIFLTTILLFVPFYTPELVDNFLNSIGLWFNNFEFNASFYYIFREIGYSFRGYNEIAIIGKIIPIVVILFLLGVTILRENASTKQFIAAMLFVLSFYFFSSTTIHPWYLATLVLLSVFTRYRFAMVWSFLVILSYSAYSQEIFKENLVLISIEYILVFAVLIWELTRYKEKYSIF